MIERISTAALVAVVAGCLTIAYMTPAHATPAGRNCSFSSVTDPTVENGETHTGQVNGGPITDDTQPFATVTLTCTIQVGAANSTHAGADAVSCSGTGTGAAEVACQASYIAPDGQPVYLCTQTNVNGVIYYHDSVAGTWSLSNSVPCGEAFQQEVFPGPLGLLPCARSYHPPYWDTGFMCPDDPQSVVDGIFEILGILGPIERDVVDPTLCPALAAAAPGIGPVIIDSGGDTYVDFDNDGVADADELFWDCPPYEV